MLGNRNRFGHGALALANKYRADKVFALLKIFLPPKVRVLPPLPSPLGVPQLGVPYSDA